MQRVCSQLQQLQPLDGRVLTALQDFHNGWQPPEVRLSQLCVPCFSLKGASFQARLLDAL
jgi:hypothetical protein